MVIVDSFANAKPTVVGRLEALTGTHLEVHGFDLTDKDKTERLFAAEKFDAVIHFAGLKAVGESVQIPLDYYVNNLESTFSLLQAMRRHGCDLLVFSSSATVYGEVAPVPYQEDYEPLSASSPYGRTKVMIEHVLRDGVGQMGVVVVAGTLVGLLLGTGLVEVMASGQAPVELTTSAIVVTVASMVGAGLVGSLVAFRRITNVEPAIALGTEH